MSSGRIPVIIDTDPGIDDIIALLFALASPELDVLAITVSYGNTDMAASKLNVLKTYQALTLHLEKHPEQQSRFPNYFSTSKPILAEGSEIPLEGDLHSAQYFHGRDGLGDISKRHADLDVARKDDGGDASHPQVQITGTSAVDVALDLLRRNPARSITYIALGPLTNLARLMRADAALVRNKIGRIVCMGGALDVPGNTSPVAEFNFFADPYAVRELLHPSQPELGLPLERFLMLPLDITTPHELPFPVYKAQVDPTFENTSCPSLSKDKSPLTHFTSSFLERTREVMLEFGKDAMELHDIVAVWCAIENPPVADAATPLNRGWKASRRTFEIERTGELTRGMLVVDRREDESAYAPGANRAQVQAELEKAALPHGQFESTALPAQVEIEEPPQKHTSQGVLCVTDTPGPQMLLNLLLKRVWGVEGIKSS
ncbi:hypothetical protein HGRIS_002319 [Hohenbuehelia grisea]|uniref:Inosine/uridine-preferring nucleoside hydrolase domain-containing protein n=1 Tax=Hohenbuehelia grisea TaxID=104357 RepID=A0ABR3JLA0_9AGAR